jgi:hypothetical protein
MNEKFKTKKSKFCLSLPLMQLYLPMMSIRKHDFIHVMHSFILLSLTFSSNMFKCINIYIVIKYFLFLSNYSRISLNNHVLSFDILFSNYCNLLDIKVFSQIQNKIKILADLTRGKSNLRQFLFNLSLSMYDRTYQFTNRHALLQFSRDFLDHGNKKTVTLASAPFRI